MVNLNKLREGFYRDIYLLTGSMFIRRIVMGFLHVVRAIYFALLGYNAVEIGLLLSIATLISAINNILFGYLSDKFSRKPFLILGTLLGTARTALFAISIDFWVLAIAQGLGAMGEGVGAGQPVVSGYITEKVDIKKRFNVYSTLAITSSLAATIGLAFGGFPHYIERFGYDIITAHQMLWWTCTGINLLSLFFLLPLKEGPRKTITRKSMVEEKKIRNWGIITKFILVRLTSGFGWSMMNSLMTLYFFYKFNLGTDVLGPVYAVSRFVTTFTYLFAPSIVERLGSINTLILTRLASAALAIGFAFARWYPLAILLMALNRIIVLFSLPIRQTFASGIVDPGETATVIGLSNSVRMGAQTIAPSLAGYMFDNISFQLPFLTGSLFMAMNGLIYWVYFRERSADTHMKNASTL